LSFELSNFLVKAKRNKYGKKKESNSKILNDGSQYYEYNEYNYSFQEKKYGNNPFSGQEVVYKNGNPIWSMNYYGEILDNNIDCKIFQDFLLRALKLVMKDMPYRGPSKFSSRDWTYSINIDGSIKKFRGEEKVYYNNKNVFTLYVHGGNLCSLSIIDRS
jgi:hypothetical protein